MATIRTSRRTRLVASLVPICAVLASCGPAGHPAMRDADQPHAAVLLRVRDEFHPDAQLEERVLVDGREVVPDRARGGALLRLAPGARTLQVHTAYFDEHPSTALEIVYERRPVDCGQGYGDRDDCWATFPVPREVVRVQRVDRGGCVSTARLRVHAGERRVVDAWITGPNRCGMQVSRR